MNTQAITTSRERAVLCEKDTISIFDKYAMFSVILYPILQIYTFGNEYVNLGFIMTIPTCFVYLIRYARSRERSKGVGKHMLSMWITFVCICLFSLVGADNIDIVKVVGRFGLWLYNIIMLILTSRFAVREYLVRIFSNLGLIVSIILLFEIAYWALTGVALSFYLFPSLAPDRSTAYAQIAGQLMIRPSSLFLEPSSFGCYTSIALAVTLFELPRNRKRLVKALVMILAMLISTSASAIYLMLIVVGWYFFVSNRSKWILCLAAFVIVLVYAFFPFANETIVYGLGRIETSSSRLINFMPYVKGTSAYTMLFGCGVGNQSAIYGNYLASQVSSFLSGTGRVIVESGIVGIIVFGIVTIGDCFKIKGPFKIYALLFLAMNLFETALFSWFLVLTLIWLGSLHANAQTGGNG